MNPRLARLQPYPFQKLSALLHDITPNSSLPQINLSIGEPKHATPKFICDALSQNLAGLARYPTTLGDIDLRLTIADWLKRRYKLKNIDPQREIIPVNGSREALFAFAQAVVDPTVPDPVVVSPNPFYQIYEGATLLAGATPAFLNTVKENNFSLDFSELPISVWKKTQLLYVCSPGNPTGTVLSMEDWRAIFDLSDQYNFVIAADECYSEIYFDEDNPPLGALQAAQQLQRDSYPRLVIFSSLSKRSNVPGLRSGFVAGDAQILEKFLLYRTYHGCAMSPPTHAASIAAWQEEEHVKINRTLYREKFLTVTKILREHGAANIPAGGFYLWLETPCSDTDFARFLYRDYNVIILPGSFLGRTAQGRNPGEGFVRVALVATPDECAEAARRINELMRNLKEKNNARITVDH